MARILLINQTMTIKFLSRQVVALPLFLVLCSLASANAQDVAAAVKGIEKAIAANDAPQLAKYMANEVEITINSKEEVFPKKQAEFVVKEFFMNYPVSNFRIIHEGNSSDTHYAVGEYVSSRGRYDTNIFIKRTAAGFQVEQLRFERSK